MEQPAGPGQLLFNPSDFLSSEEPHANGELQLSVKLRKRSQSDPDVLQVTLSGSPSLPFGDVRRNGNRSAAHLIRQGKLFRQGQQSRELVRGHHEIHPALPCIQVSEANDLCHPLLFTFLHLGTGHPNAETAIGFRKPLHGYRGPRQRQIARHYW